MKPAARSRGGTAAQPNLKWIVPLAAFLALVFAACWYVMRGRYLRYIVTRHIGLGFENPGVSLDVVETPCNWHTVQPCMYPIPTEVRVITPESVFMMNSATDLRGFVTIRNSRQALHFARLDTTQDLLYARPSGALEIINHSQAKLPEFADTGASSGDGNESGHFAVLSDADYRAEGFSPPILTMQGGAFEIKRWVCLFDGLNGKNVQLWNETVSRDGKYTRRVIQSRPVPKRPGQTWYFDGLM